MLQCMEKYKNNFAIEVAKVMQENLSNWKNLQKEFMLETFCSLGSIMGYLFWSILCFIPINGEEYILLNHIILFLFVITIILCIDISWANMEYQKKLKTIMFPVLVKVFSKNIKYPSTPVSLDVINQSNLFTKQAMNVVLDDSFEGEYNNIPFKIQEGRFESVKYDFGEHKDISKFFIGITMHFMMHKKIKSRVLIYSKGLFKNKVPKGFEKVEFEYEKFNKKYDVYVQKAQMEAGGQIEARYLFNITFLERFMQLQTSFKINKMQCSVYGDSMLILLATNKDLFEMNHLFKRIDDIHQYQHLFNEFASVLSFIDVLNLSSRTGL